MADSKYTEATAKALLKKHGIDINGKAITLKRAGIKLWGAIDYLVNHHKYNFQKEEKAI